MTIETKGNLLGLTVGALRVNADGDGDGNLRIVVVSARFLGFSWLGTPKAIIARALAMLCRRFNCSPVQTGGTLTIALPGMRIL
jgi:hypothetical protein